MRLGELGEFGGCGLALGGEGGGGLLIFRGGFFEIGAESLEGFVAVFDFRKLAGYVFTKGDDLGDGLAVFSLEPIEQGESIFDFGEALGRGVDALCVIAEAGGYIGDGGAGGGELLRGFGEAAVVAGELVHVANCVAESGFGG